MSRRTRKKKAWKEYSKQQAKKAMAIIQLSIDSALAITKAISINDMFQAEMIRVMCYEQQKHIQWQPIFKPNKYGYFPKPAGIMVSIKCDTSSFDDLEE